MKAAVIPKGVAKVQAGAASPSKRKAIKTPWTDHKLHHGVFRTQTDGIPEGQLEADHFSRKDLSVVLANEQEHDGQGLFKWVVGHNQFLSVFEPAAAKAVLTSSDTDKDEVLEPLKALFRDGILVATTERWKERRRLLMPAFTSLKPNGLLPHFQQLGKDTCDRLEHQAAEGAVNVEQVLRAMSIDGLGRTLVGYDFHALKGEGGGALAALDYTMKETNRRIITGVVLDEEGEEFRRSRERFEGLLDTAVASCTPGDGSVVDYLQQQNDDPEKMRDDFIDLFANATNTTSSAVSWCLFCLAQEPEQWKMVQEEIQSVLEKPTAGAHGDLTFDKVLQLKRTRMAIVEALRLFPGPPRLWRHLTSDVTLPGGQTLPKGSKVCVDLMSLHRCEQCYENPEAFDLTRWERETESYSPSSWVNSALHPPAPVVQHAYVPFGIGPRACLGNNFAMLEATAVLTEIARRFSSVSLALDPEEMGVESSFASVTTAIGNWMFFHQ